MAQRFGRTHRRALTSASEVFRALSNTIDGFDAYLREARAKGLDFVIFRDRRNIGHEEFELPARDELRIIPVIREAKSGSFPGIARNGFGGCGHMDAELVLQQVT